MLPLATSTWDASEYTALQSVIESGMFSMGKQVAEFEKNFAAYVNSKYAVMVNSGSSANLLAVAAMCYLKEGGLKRGDEIIVPAVSWSTTYYPLYQYGLKLKFVDIDINTLNIDLVKVEAAISEKTKAIMVVNLLGNPVDYNTLRNVIGGRDIYVIEDNCESLGATLSGKKAGTFGILGTFSTFFSHHISTMEGGMVVTENEELYHLMLSLRSHGWTRNLPQNNKICELSSNPFEESFRFVLPGYNLRPLEMSGAVGLEQLKKLPQIIQGRRNNAAVFVEQFSKIKGILIQKEIGESSWFGFSIILDGGSEKRNGLIKLLQDNGVECRPIVAGNFTKNEVIDYFDCEIFGRMIAADMVHDCGLFIGNHHYDISRELREIANLVSGYI